MRNATHDGPSETVRPPIAVLSVLLFAAVLSTFCFSRTRAQDTSVPQSAIAVEGTVRDASGRPVADTLVVLEEQGPRKPARTKSDQDGHFVFSVNKPGTYSIRAEKAGVGSIAADPMRLESGETKRCDLVLATPGASRSASATSCNSASGTAGIDFSDEPNFTVAGVKDWSNAGLHGSDARMRTSDALTRETLTLKPTDPEKKTNASPDAFYQSALEFRAKGDLARAREEARKSLAVAETADAHRLLGDLEERLGDPLAAVSEFERAVRVEPSERNYFEWGAELLRHKAAQPAAEVFNMGSKAHPDSSRLLAGLGVALYAAGSYAEAALRLCAASDLQPADPAPYLFLGEIEKSSPTLLPCSKERLARFLREQPENPQANYFYALSRWKTDRELQERTESRAVEKLLEKSVTLDPQLADGYVQLGIVRAERGDLDSAIEAYKKAIAVDPHLSDAHYRLGLAYKRAGQDAKARQEFATYQQTQKSEAADAEKQRQRLKQFSIIFKDRSEPTAAPSANPR